MLLNKWKFILGSVAWGNKTKEMYYSYDFFCFFSPKPRSQVWILIYRSWFIVKDFLRRLNLRFYLHFDHDRTLNLLCWMALVMYLPGFSKKTRWGCGTPSISKTSANSRLRNVTSKCDMGSRTIVRKAVRGGIISSMTSPLNRAWLQSILGRAPSSNMMSTYFQWNLDGQ